ncbi:MAG: Spy/CpxP family protein refolding chaperone, partial [Caldisericota bacterium]|nr:Spy/CpxP family protein refolding chaperone [Caldisericota bacterium]
MSASRKLIGIASTLVLLGLTQTGFAANNQTSAHGWLLAMDDMQPKQPDSVGHPGSARQPQQMAQGRMMDDKQMGRGRMMMDDRKTPDSAPMQDQGKMGQQSDQGGMWTRTERMMRGQMGGMPGMGAASGTADVTERMEGRIAFLKAELQITDKQMADWNVLADALRSGR